MNAICHVSDGNLLFGPTWEQWLEQPPAYLLVETADPVHGSATPQRKESHIERLRIVDAVAAAQSQQALKREVQALLRIVPQILGYQIGMEAIEAGFHCGVGREQVAGSRRCQRRLKWLLILLHKTAGARQDEECCVPFVQVEDARRHAATIHDVHERHTGGARVVFGPEHHELRPGLREAGGVPRRQLQVDDLFVNGKPGVLWLTDKDGRTVGVPTDKLAYVEIGADKASRAVGFSSRS